MNFQLTEAIDPNKVVLRLGPSFHSTVESKEKEQRFSTLREKIKTFTEIKRQNPLQRTPNDLPTSGFFTQIKGIQHYKLFNDLRLWWRISGSDPVYIDLLGVYTHDETGTGQPGQPKIQKSAVGKMQKDLANMPK